MQRETLVDVAEGVEEIVVVIAETLIVHMHNNSLSLYT